jgi:hypothetical protein
MKKRREAKKCSNGWKALCTRTFDADDRTPRWLFERLMMMKWWKAKTFFGWSLRCRKEALGMIRGEEESTRG